MMAILLRTSKNGYALPAVAASASCVSPLRAGDHLMIETTVEAGANSLTVAFRVLRTGIENLAAEGEALLVLLDEAFDSVPPTAAMRDWIPERGGGASERSCRAAR